jgi:hypothetical protein
VTFTPTGVAYTLVAGFVGADQFTYAIVDAGRHGYWNRQPEGQQPAFTVPAMPA